MANAPYEIITGPVQLYWAPVGEAFPDVSEAPAGNWALIGTSGDKNYTDDGVTVTHNQTIEQFRFLGTTLPRKASRTEEDITIGVTVVDLTADQYRIALNQNTVTAIAAGSGTAGVNKLGLSRGSLVNNIALLIRSDFSPEGDTWASQYEFPVVYEMGSHEVVYQKGEPAGLALEFAVIADESASSEDEEGGRFITQTADPS